MPNDYFVDGNVHLLESFDIRRGGLCCTEHIFLKNGCLSVGSRLLDLAVFLDIFSIT